uniref:Uncharacterized protein n=1 Tax=Cannabis sativa TaxID=3483 RepID=A0A803PWX6_CANSA
MNTQSSITTPSNRGPTQQAASTKIPYREVNYERASKRTQTQKCGFMGSPSNVEWSHVREVSFERVNFNNAGNQSRPWDSLPDLMILGHPVNLQKVKDLQWSRTQKLYHESEEYEIRRVKSSKLLHMHKYFCDERGAWCRYFACGPDGSSQYSTTSKRSRDDSIFMRDKTPQFPARLQDQVTTTRPRSINIFDRLGRKKNLQSDTSKKRPVDMHITTLDVCKTEFDTLAILVNSIIAPKKTKFELEHERCSPLSDQVKALEIPLKFKNPVWHPHTAMLPKIAQQWYLKLSPGYINSWGRLKEEFYNQFSPLRHRPIKPNDLVGIK